MKGYPALSDTKIITYAGIMLFGVFISSVSQVLLKTAANKQYSTRLKEYLNIYVIFAYLLFFLSSVCTLLAYRAIPLSMGPILESSSYIFVTFFGYFVFHEKVGKMKLGALLLIIFGIIVYSSF
ncbi:MAG: EamA family transporter [Clostridia bacterium]|nr:EamA family transporter [Clostridia bacterium]